MRLEPRARGHGKFEGTGTRDEIWHGETGARGHGMLEGTGARRARDLSDFKNIGRRPFFVLFLDKHYISQVIGFDENFGFNDALCTLWRTLESMTYFGF